MRTNPYKASKLYKSLFFLALGLFIHFLAPKHANATVMVGDVESHGKTYINYFMNHNYIKRDKPYLYEFSAKSLEGVRRELVINQKLQDIMVLLEIPSPIFNQDLNESKIQIKSDCQIGYGDTVGTGAARLSKCYHIYFVGEPSYDKFLTLLLALQNVKEEGEPIAIESIENYAKTNKIYLTDYPGRQYYTDPVWSSDSRLVSFGVWIDGTVYFEVYDTLSSQFFVTDPLDGMIATEPVWSADGNYLFFSSLSEVGWFDTNTKITKKIELDEMTEGNNYEVLLSFEPVEIKLLFAFDKNLLTGYEVYELDPASGMIEKRMSDIGYLSWQRDKPRNLYTVTSPNGLWEARASGGVNYDIREINKVDTKENTYKDPVKKPINNVSNVTKKDPIISCQNLNYTYVGVLLGAVVVGVLFIILIKKSKKRLPSDPLAD